MPDEITATAEVAAPETAAPAAETQQSSGLGDGFVELVAMDPGEDAPETPAPEPAKPAKPAKAAVATEEPRGPGRPSSREPKLAAIADPATREMLKQMANGPFNKFYDIALKLQNGEFVSKADHEKLLKEKDTEWEGKVQATRFIDHERGYQLTPEYEKAAGTLSQVEAEADFWNEQLGNLRAGQPVSWLVRGADGKVQVAAQTLDPKDPQLEGRLLSKITQATTLQRELSRELEQLPGKHKTEFQKLHGTIENVNKELFAGINDKDWFKAAAAKEIERIPASVRGRPEFQLLGNALAAGKLLLTQNAQLKAQVAQLKGIKSAGAGAAPDPAESLGDADIADDKADIAALDRMANGR